MCPRVQSRLVIYIKTQRSSGTNNAEQEVYAFLLDDGEWSGLLRVKENAKSRRRRQATSPNSAICNSAYFHTTSCLSPIHDFQLLPSPCRTVVTKVCPLRTSCSSNAIDCSVTELLLVQTSLSFPCAPVPLAHFSYSAAFHSHRSTEMMQ
jgi:hypothetical protein